MIFTGKESTQALKRDAFLARIDLVARHPRLPESGRLVVQEGIFRISGFTPAKVDLLADWRANPFGRRSWQWGTAAFNFLPWIVAYHSNSLDDAAIEYALRLIRSWRKASRKELVGYEFLNHDHATAVRCENVMLFVAYLDLNGLRREDIGMLVEFVDELATQLEADSFYSKHTNHGLEQARILAMAADFLPARNASERRWTLAVSRLMDELDFAFTPDGVHVENSPAYHQYVCDAFLKIAEVLPAERITPLLQTMDRILPKAMGFLAHVIRPDAKFPIIGDTGAKWAVNPFQRYSDSEEFQWIEHVASRRERGRPPPSTIATYPEAGYAIVRDRWKPVDRKGREYHAVMKCGYRSNYHRHDDDFQIVMMCGEDWLIDGGAYGYAEDHPVRRYLRSKWAHNVPVIDTGADRWPRLASKPHAASMQVREDEGELEVRAKSGGYPGYAASRDVRFSPRRRMFVVHDRLSPEEASAGDVMYRSLWHVPATRDIFRRNQDILVRSRVSSLALMIRNKGDDFDKVGLFRPGLEHYANAVVSWQANKLQPAKIIAFSKRANVFDAELSFEMVEIDDLDGWEPI